jgi:hypothetical protein
MTGMVRVGLRRPGGTANSLSHGESSAKGRLDGKPTHNFRRRRGLEPGPTLLTTTEVLAEMRMDPGSAFGRPGTTFALYGETLLRAQPSSPRKRGPSKRKAADGTRRPCLRCCPLGVAAEYWVPAFAGMTVVVMLGAGFREAPDQQRTVTLRCVQTGTTPAGVANRRFRRTPHGRGGRVVALLGPRY